MGSAMPDVLYFAYGSNMSEARLSRRVGSATAVGAAMLSGHRLVFHKKSTNDGSGKCDIVPAHGDLVAGVLFRLAPSALQTLDRCEGRGYSRVRVAVLLESGREIEADTYKATLIDPSLKPYTWYVRHVAEGAKRANLAPAYVAAIEAVEAVPDPDRARELRELGIYG